MQYTKTVDDFADDVYSFCRDHPEYSYKKYKEVLKNNSISLNNKSMTETDISDADDSLIIALITGAVRGEKTGNAALLQFVLDGSLLRWLKRLKQIDDA